ncbi:DUF2115 domain-containing protein [Methanococcus voltae]|uniref:UPF0305 protein Mvol_1007 n=1 Tax=Methanococcus voltae (strain ATCC BAA-1334 / A3) TaxID=456320 RepID=D7DU54_METV3|nr:DUF2115 domain-containing protein [Methanococcus voltae]MCS3900464.1 uncharacterized protein (UPF0305 family) [Methanococcus voltae]
MDIKTLLTDLKDLSFEISIYDFINAKSELEKELKYLPEEYKQCYIDDFFTFFPKIIKEIKSLDLNSIETFEINDEDLKKLIDRLEVLSNKERKSYKIYRIVIPYLVFFAKKPLHALTTKFPGKKSIVSKKGVYYCPIKEAQKNDLSICEFCICKDINELER